MKVIDPRNGEVYAMLPVFACEKDIDEEVEALGLPTMSETLQDIRELILLCARNHIITEQERNAYIEQLYYAERSANTPIKTMRQDLQAQNN